MADDNKEQREGSGLVTLFYNGPDSKVTFNGQVCINDGTWYVARLFRTNGVGANGKPTKVDWSGSIKRPGYDDKDGSVIAYVNVKKNDGYDGKNYFATMWLAWNRQVVTEEWGYPDDLIAFLYYNDGVKPMMNAKLYPQQEAAQPQRTGPPKGGHRTSNLPI